MNDNRTLIQSSIISLIIVMLGLFMLCVGRAPKINMDGPLIEGGSDESSASELSDEDFLNLLEAADQEIQSETDTSEKSILLAMGNNQTASSSSSDEGDLDEILKLLDLEESASDDEKATADATPDAEDEQSDELNQLLFGKNDKKETASPQTKQSEAYANLDSEITRLEEVLRGKNSKIDSIQQTIDEYNKKLSELEESGSPLGDGKTGSIKYASHVATERINSSVANREVNSTATFTEQYDMAINYFHSRQYQIAILAFEKLKPDDPYHPLADNCQYWIGECYFARGNYYQAIVEFEKVFSFDAADKKDDAQIMMGLAFMKLGETAQAKNDFSWLLACYHGSEYYKRALRFMSEL